jgi:hypothetical protein
MDLLARLARECLAKLVKPTCTPGNSPKATTYPRCASRKAGRPFI